MSHDEGNTYLGLGSNVLSIYVDNNSILLSDYSAKEKSINQSFCEMIKSLNKKIYGRQVRINIIKIPVWYKPGRNYYNHT